MTCPKQSVKISVASLLHFSLGSAALLLVKKSSYPIMSGAMLEWSPCPYLQHITWSFSQHVYLSFFPFFPHRSMYSGRSHHVPSCISSTDSLSGCISSSLSQIRLISFCIPSLFLPGGTFFFCRGTFRQNYLPDHLCLSPLIFFLSHASLLDFVLLPFNRVHIIQPIFEQMAKENVKSAVFLWTTFMQK